jgi:predicted SnoaL-like aldol condensation-catalyzing enzyme
MTTTTTLASNKQIVAAFYQAAFNDKDIDAATQYLADKYVQHNPLIADGIEGLQARLAFLKETFPALTVVRRAGRPSPTERARPGRTVTSGDHHRCRPDAR